MGYVNKVNDPNQQEFPGAAFEVSGDAPYSQCDAGAVNESTPDWSIGTSIISSVYQCANYNFIGKKATISGSASDDGTYDITAQSADTITIDHTFVGAVGAATVAIKDADGTHLTRNKASFAQFIHNNGYAYTIKGGKLWTDCPNLTLANACPVTWDPGE